MQDGQIRDLLEIVLFVESENLRNAVVFHDDAVDYVSDSGVIREDPSRT